MRFPVTLTGNAEGCHHLIREGATLIYHPQQVLEDVNGQLGYERYAYKATDMSASNSDHTAHSINTDSSSSISASGQSAQSNIKSPPSAVVVPEHLTVVYEQLDWHGQDLDALLVATELAAPQLIGQLMELELLGVISVQGGRYLRV